MLWVMCNSHNDVCSFLPVWYHASTVLATVWPSVCVYYRLEFCRNVNRLSCFLAWGLLLTYPTLCFYGEIQVSAKTKVLPSETLF